MPQLNFYQELTDNLSALLSGENDFIASLANTSALIYEKLDKINWVGFYLNDGNSLVLGPFKVKWLVSGLVLEKESAERHSQKTKF